MGLYNSINRIKVFELVIVGYKRDYGRSLVNDGRQVVPFLIRTTMASLSQLWIDDKVRMVTSKNEFDFGRIRKEL